MFDSLAFIQAQTWLSSRAFPSSLLDDPPSLNHPDAFPILVPIADMLNHARGTPISWSIYRPEISEGSPSLSLISHGQKQAGDELYNNYGPKPNDELLLGYGFVVEDNPEDMLLLKLPANEKRYSIGRKASGEAEMVWNEIGRRLQAEFPFDGDSLDVMEAELELEIGQVLPEMVAKLLERLPTTAGLEDDTLPGVRPEVRKMTTIYIQGALV